MFETEVEAFYSTVLFNVFKLHKYMIIYKITHSVNVKKFNISILNFNITDPHICGVFNFCFYS